MSQVALISVHPPVCPRCGKKAELIEKDAIVGLDDSKRVARGLPPNQVRNIYGCSTCTTPIYGIGQLTEEFYPDPQAPGCGVNHKPFTFLADGTEVL